MKIVFSAYHNPNFITITEYVESALSRESEYRFFDSKQLVIPRKLRERVHFLQTIDLLRLNRNLLFLVDEFKPNIFLEAGGTRVLPTTVRAIKDKGIKTVLWTIDPPRDFNPIIQAAPFYDFIFTGGSEAYELLKGRRGENLYFLPFACDITIHKPVDLSQQEKARYGSDVVFVGTLHHKLYPSRIELLEAISDFNLSLWGPGIKTLSDKSPLIPLVRGGETNPRLWTKIYSAAKMVLCIHYREPQGKIPCYQASPRVYEALACKRLLLVDDQKDINSLFENGKHLVIFKNKNDLREKITYYLNHPQEREKIAEAGYQEVIRKHTYHHRIKEMLHIIKEGD